ncbi:MAG: M20 family metallopeptidase [Planctomycetaceae bacterium]|nr:M20 family metallopeptidase [Planctomycetaceae bacterium]
MSTLEELQARLTSLTRDLILIPSTEDRPAERRRCFEFLHNHLDSLPNVQFDYFDCNEHRSLVVRPQGVDAPAILLCGHLDVIEHPQPECYRSHIEEGRIYGPGSGDMKGQNAILVELFRALHKRHPGISLGLALTSDEERGGADGIRFLCEEQNLRCGVVIVPDGGSLNDVTIEEKGVLHARVQCCGQEAHGARPWLGDNALELLVERLQALKQYFQQFWPNADIKEQVNHWFPTCCVTVVSTDNTTPNRIPDRAEAILDIRFPPPESVSGMIATVSEVLGPRCTLEPLMTAEPTHLDPDPLFVEITQEITGRPVRMVRASGGSDGRFFRQFGIPVNLSRPLVGNLHAIDEWIDIASMVTYYQICERYIERKLVGQRDVR